jgi:hypothetical protein
MDTHPDHPYDAHSPRGSHLRKWRPAYLALAVLLTVVSVAFAGRDESSTATTTTSTSNPVATTQPFIALSRTLVLGDKGDDVKRMQQRLKDLPEQVLIVFKQDKPVLITHISSGDNKPWCEEVTIDPGEDGNLNGTEPIKKGICGESLTPAGLYYFYNRRSGTRESKLGTMWNPVYFNGGVAVHGAAQVPIRPASHGCIRIPMFISEYFPSLVAYGDRIYIFDGVKEPEEYGSPLPPADKPDPNYTTTTSEAKSTTTTIAGETTTSIAPTTTAKKQPQQSTTVPTTVPVPAATTTVAPAQTAAPTTTGG